MSIKLVALLMNVIIWKRCSKEYREHSLVDPPEIWCDVMREYECDFVALTVITIDPVNAHKKESKVKRAEMLKMGDATKFSFW